MSHSLSIVLPVLNDERHLTDWVSEGIAAAAELTSDFELLILDDGSTDETVETARDLACRYPQVRVIRTPRRPRAYLICPVGMCHSLGEVILYRPLGCDQPLERMGSLWRRLGDSDVVIASSTPAPGSGVRGWAQRLLGSDEQERFGLRLARRSAAERLHRTRQPADEARLPQWLDEQGVRWKRVALAEPSAPRQRLRRPKFLDQPTARHLHARQQTSVR